MNNIRLVLVEPSHPGNIGGAARAAKTMGLTDLAVVRPKRFPDPQSEWRAAGAQDVLERVQVYDSVDEAIAACHVVVGTSTRSRRIPWPVELAADAAPKLVAAARSGRVAVLFGRETSGLTNDELQRCNFHLAIPANPDYPSLNLAMAVQVVCYELYLARTNGSDEAATATGENDRAVEEAWDRAGARADQVAALFDHLEQVLVDIGFLDPANPGQSMTRLRRMLARIRPDETEVQMLRGILHQIERAGRT